jgi:hypothetical protein
MYNIQISKTLLSIFIAASAFQTTSAQTPPNFIPATVTHLDVAYGKVDITPAGRTVQGIDINPAGITVAGNGQSQPYQETLLR